MHTHDPLAAVHELHKLMNEGRVEELNALISDDFFAVFSLGNAGDFETYDAETYRRGNFEALAAYQGKDPRWEYVDFGHGMRDETEFVISSAIDFYLLGELRMKALVTEVFRLEQDQWKLVRQYMEKYRP